MVKKKHSEFSKGITLISLIITIILLLILAGVVIQLTLGDKGILIISKNSEKEYEKAQIKEELQLEILDIQSKKLGQSKDTSRNDLKELENIGAIIEEIEPIAKGEYKDYQIEIDENYEVTILEKLKEEKPVAVINLLTKEDGIKEAKIQVTATTTEGEIQSIEAENGAILETENSNADKIFVVKENGEYIFKITGTNGRKILVKIKVTNLITQIEAVSILEGISKITYSGLKKMKIIENVEEDITYQLNTIVYKGDLVLDGETETEGAKLTKANKIYEFGKERDVATNNSYAQNTVVLKVEGNLTINEGVTLTSVRNGYGGPKGMIIYCTGTLTNKGAITMTQRGSKAIGQNVYLWKNKNNSSYEKVPNVGVSGGNGGWGNVLPNCANTGATPIGATNRATGGGRTEEQDFIKDTKEEEEEMVHHIQEEQEQVVDQETFGQAGSNDGGAGGNGVSTNRGSLYKVFGAGGGAGNPGGYGSGDGHTAASGTGGLLVIYANTFTNNAVISSNGSQGGNGYRVGGGGSGRRIYKYFL